MDEGKESSHSTRSMSSSETEQQQREEELDCSLNSSSRSLDDKDEDDLEDEEALLPRFSLRSNGKLAAGSTGSSYFEYIKNRFSPQYEANFKSMLLALLVIQTSAAILTGRYTRSSVTEEELYEISHLVLVIECVKFIASLILEQFTTEGKLLDSVKEHILQRPMDSLKVLVPSVLYVIQNSLVYIALSNLSAPVFLALQQGKLICTALVSVLMLHRSYSIKQWICLCTLAVGVAIIALDEKKGSQVKQTENVNLTVEEEEELAEHAQQVLLGLLAVTASCFSSAFAGVYFEKVLAPEKAIKTKVKSSGDDTATNAENPQTPSLYMRNIQLSFFSMIFAYLQGVYESREPHSAIDSPPENAQTSISFFHGFTVWVWVLVALQAGGGLLVSAVMKYADNVLKGLAVGML